MGKNVLSFISWFISSEKELMSLEFGGCRRKETQPVSRLFPPKSSDVNPFSNEFEYRCKFLETTCKGC